MTVFRGYMLLLKRNLGMTILYLCIFIGLIIMMGEIQAGKLTKSYEAEKIDVAVINRDESSLSDGVYDYMKQHHNIISIGKEEKDIQNALFYRYVKYVVIIPEGYQKEFLDGKGKVETVKLPDSDSAQYLDAQIDTFLNSVNVYYKSGYAMQDAVSHALTQSEKSGEVTMLDQNGNAGLKEKYVFLFQYFPYMIISVLGYGISTVLMKFRDKEIRQRMLCSAVSGNKQNLSGVCAFMMSGIFIWILTMAALMALYGKRFVLSPNKWYFIANSLIMLLVALSIAFLLGMLIKRPNVMTGAVNTVSLGMSFLCGVFVPLEILGGGVKKVVQFLPVYWYEVINELLGKYNELSVSMKQTMWKGFSIQLVFAVACVCLALMVSRMQRQE